MTVILGLAGLMTPAPVAAQDAGVTGAAEAAFPNGTAFNGVPLKGLTLGQGMFIAQDGSAAGQFQAVLLGTSLLGTPQNVTVEGEVRGGSVGADGSATFSGTATVDRGDGTLPLAGVPFAVTVSAGSLGLILNAVALPTATVTAGSITIK
ncbi:MAG TPA: hypothetical protein VK531_13085 [Gemmatimonadales bacterium]|nr:hypothetical protein [Gemmatimonadales bacterium]